MPNWNEILEETRGTGNTHDIIRRKYIARLADVTERNVVVYYSGFLQKRHIDSEDLSINDYDKNGFMTAFNRLDKAKGLDLLLHTPGGDMAATESLVEYLRQMFGTDIRAFVPQLAMSGGTMIACASKVILMGRSSSIGPIDPQIGGLAAHGIIEEFMQASNEIAGNPSRAGVWQPIIAKYFPTLIGESAKAIKWAEKLAREWLKTGMLSGNADADQLADKIVKELGDHSLTLSHSRHISAERAKDIGLNVEMIEDNQDLQDAVLSVHHACMQTLTATPAYKIIENHIGAAFIQRQQVIQQFIQQTAPQQT